MSRRHHLRRDTSIHVVVPYSALLAINPQSAVRNHQTPSLNNAATRSEVAS